MAKRGNHEGHEGRTYELLGQRGAGWAKGRVGKAGGWMIGARLQD
jgi:hypothetical protein